MQHSGTQKTHFRFSSLGFFRSIHLTDIGNRRKCPEDSASSQFSIGAPEAGLRSSLVPINTSQTRHE
ncbi:hypothetical protein SCLCIDRAFT_1221827 [Scleroderma citrinum Foug A]|uniref:Uncharacterized protein n=1 Tax=Scleroderma citrinum Foug A TaxID=1036808 RepID=A0A0C2YYF1_9AGAM|nr:hypothetical protein SCLCIDRAFT_1221827 [Scleroderma citrinum Foug A]